MIKIRKSNDRFKTQISWLKSYHSFSFGEHWHQDHESFGNLRVINEDFVEKAQGFSTHGHRDMEIVTYVVEGALAHKDSLGSESTILPGQSQMMSAGTGIRHSEFNPLEDQQSHFVQIWILPDKRSVNPRYGQKTFLSDKTKGKLTLIASREGSDTAVSVHQDIEIYALKNPSSKGEYAFKSAEQKKIWIQNILGRSPIDLKIANQTIQLESGDGCAIENEKDIVINWDLEAEFLVFVQ